MSMYSTLYDELNEKYHDAVADNKRLREALELIVFECHVKRDFVSSEKIAKEALKALTADKGQTNENP